MLSMGFDRSDAKSKLASLGTFFVDAPGPFKVELNADWHIFISREARCLLPSLTFNAMGGNDVILIWTRQHQIDGLHVEEQRPTVSLARMLSPVKYIQPIAN